MSEVPPDPGEAEEPTDAPVVPHIPGPPGADAGGGDDGDFESIVAGLTPEGTAGSPDDGGPGVLPADVSVEALLDDIERLTGERDDYLNRLRRAQADFENSKKRLQRDAEGRADAVTGRLVEDLLPVLDACDGAIAHGEAAVEPVFAALVQILEKNGLERIDPAGDVFDPTRHEAVMHEPAADDEDPALSVVADVLRIGYAWRGRIVRAAMVKVRG
ncbi:MAG: nucleotide exchange factor GrpE [Acidimicrobiia bacterium]|nr:nucleotide exchange factor GrpE [Acidimicrobiia bacterium]